MFIIRDGFMYVCSTERTMCAQATVYVQQYLDNYEVLWQNCSYHSVYIAQDGESTDMNSLVFWAHCKFLTKQQVLDKRIFTNFDYSWTIWDIDIITMCSWFWVKWLYIVRLLVATLHVHVLMTRKQYGGYTQSTQLQRDYLRWVEISFTHQ